MGDAVADVQTGGGLLKKSVEVCRVTPTPTIRHPVGAATVTDCVAPHETFPLGVGMDPRNVADAVVIELHAAGLQGVPLSGFGEGPVPLVHAVVFHPTDGANGGGSVVAVFTGLLTA